MVETLDTHDLSSFTSNYYFGATTSTEFDYIKIFNNESDQDCMSKSSPIVSELINSTEGYLTNASQNEEITINGETGIWINKLESSNWNGTLPLSDYEINKDPCPEIIRKKSDQEIVYKQEIAIRYLRPPTPPPPGDIIIQEECPIIPKPAPPLIMRQEPPRPHTPAPLIIREIPPTAPQNCVESKIIKLPSMRRLPPPPRKVIVERLPPLPIAPQAIIIERWLPYKRQQRRVIYSKFEGPDPEYKKEKNIIIQWDPPEIKLEKEFKELGVLKMDPLEYIEKYGSSLKSPSEFPDEIKEFKIESDMILAADKSNDDYELVGDIQALSLVDLESEGLTAYKSLFQLDPKIIECNKRKSNKKKSRDKESMYNKFFTIEDAKKILLAVNNKLKREINDSKTVEFIQYLENYPDTKIDLEKFKETLKAFL